MINAVLIATMLALAQTGQQPASQIKPAVSSTTAEALAKELAEQQEAERAEALRLQLLKEELEQA